MPTRLQEMDNEIGAKRKRWQDLWNAKPNRDFTADEVSELKQLNDELSDLGSKRDELAELEAVSQNIIGKGSRPVVSDGREPEAKPARVKSIRETITESAEYKRFRERGGGTAQFNIELDVEGKTLITVGDASPQNVRLPRIEPYPQEQRTVADLMMQGTIDRGTLEYYEETTFTNAAAATAEATAKPEAAIDWTLRTESLSKIAVWIPATSEALADISWLMSTLQNRLVFMLRRTEEAQLMTGNGTAPNLSGITDRAGIQTQAKGTDPVPDAILKAANLIRVNAFYEPSAIVINPLDMQDIRLLRTADGLYIFGNPADPQSAMRLWGLEVRETTAQTENTAVVGAFSTASQIFRRTGITVTVSTEHASYFIENKVAVLAEERLGLAVYRSSAFATVTGI